ncbi:SMP-30/gluconolactonase/LRE family protein [Adhaeribacter radiodurans]|uniref:SMP-30/gluconolactonase/LRE family protein n=1 Tax=Adhaeribacter radiodurans TaxID=2745197 RepID=A0A7L7L3H9_9BACT|nr:SMP-30/gluconolactonase/LRE family protein [Adhaeribacter radiodurans]QMU27135.1 SMP-30/gluconolactonase/LRE family protein [Adhaeribacter radiodurans]
MKKCTLILLLVSNCFSGFPQETKPNIGTIEFSSNELSRVIKKDAKIEVLAEGFTFTEGPLWVEKDKMLLFSDVPANTVYKWTEAKGKEVFLKPSGYTGQESRGGFLGSNGLLLDKDGKLLLCQHGDRRIAMMDAPLHAPKTNYVTVAGEYKGKKLNSPNDLLLTAAGDLYFTDPSYGFESGNTDPKKELSYQGVYKMNKAGLVTLLTDSIEQPNGIGIFPGGKSLLISNSADKKNGWYTYDIAANGSLTNGKSFYNVKQEKAPGGCDGLKIDKAGNVFATGPGGLWIFNKTGKLLGKIKLNGIVAANCALTPDGKTIYITASNYLLRVKMQ